jgi:hypothetical protein
MNSDTRDRLREVIQDCYAEDMELSEVQAVVAEIYDECITTDPLADDDTDNNDKEE